MDSKLRIGGLDLEECGMTGTKEWLETNGLGGYASSTVEGLNTRRYHGLLVAALAPPIGRAVLLAKCEETLFLDGQPYELGCNQYPGVVHPRGFQYLQEFRLDPFPTFLYRAGSTTLERRIVMLHGRNAVMLLYTAQGVPEGATLELAPLLAYRGYHSLTHENQFLRGQADLGEGYVRFTPYPGMPSLYVCCEPGMGAAVSPSGGVIQAGVAQPVTLPAYVGQPGSLSSQAGQPAPRGIDYRQTGYWFRQFEYLREMERGQDFREDLFNPGILSFALREGETVAVIASTEPLQAGRWRELVSTEAARRRTVACTCTEGGEEATQLALAADQFLIRKGEQGHSVIAGYPWFTDWGRDTMIALPGLTLSTGRTDVARSILQTYAGSANQGMIPNRFPDRSEEPEFNTVDATLWMFVAAWRYLQATEDMEFARRTLLPFFAEVIAWHRKGTHYGIHVTEDGLLTAGEPGVQLTWMDAKVGDWVVTPRQGKPVEINALWYNALRIAAEVARRVGETGENAELAREWDGLADACRRSFRRRFWGAAHGYLADVVDGPDLEADFSLRPNQLLAISLPYPLLEGEEARRILDAVTGSLLTPYGLRTLDPHDPRYAGRYSGNQWQRDAAYHQGTVWPWLMGPYLDAFLRAKGHSEEAKATARELLRPLMEHLGEAGLGSLSEIFDGDSPHTPQGCYAQAWSVAEVLRIWLATAPSEAVRPALREAETRSASVTG
jgi:predicted glycogen debranching enzyme